MAQLPTLASTDDLVARLGRPLTSREAARAVALLRDASSQIRRACKQDFLYHENDVVTLPAAGGVIKLPQPPVTSVSSVIAISGLQAVPDLPVFWYTFDGIDEVGVSDATYSGVLNLPEQAYDDEGAYTGTFRVTYSHGYQEYPEEVVMVAANAVLSVLQAPTMASGVIGETLGAYAYRLERGGGGLAVALTEADLEALTDFRPHYGTIKLGKDGA